MKRAGCLLLLLTTVAYGQSSQTPAPTQETPIPVPAPNSPALNPQFYRGTIIRDLLERRQSVKSTFTEPANCAVPLLNFMPADGKFTIEQVTPPAGGKVQVIPPPLPACSTNSKAPAIVEKPLLLAPPPAQEKNK